MSGVYDMKEQKELSGRVSGVKFTIPHGSPPLAVGSQDGWSTGWGDEIKVKFLPAWDGSPLGYFKSVIMPDGRVIRISAANAND